MNPGVKKVDEEEKEAPKDWFADFRAKMVIVVRTDLKMRVGKVSAQVGHAGRLF